MSDSFGPIANDVAQSVFSQLIALRPAAVSGIAARMRDALIQHSIELSALPSTFVTHMRQAVAGTLNIRPGMSANEHAYKLAGGAISSEGGTAAEYVVGDIPRRKPWLLDVAHRSKMMVVDSVGDEVGLPGLAPPFITAAGVTDEPRAGVCWVSVPSPSESHDAALETLGRLDFHSAAMPDLANIELTIGSVNNALREFVSRYVREHGTAYEVGEFDSTELTYTDTLADLPPLSREYDDVDVVIVGEDELKPRTYTNEDFQVWRT